MTDVKISELNAAGALDGTEEVPIVQSSSTVRATTQDIADLAAAGLSGVEIAFCTAAVSLGSLLIANTRKVDSAVYDGAGAYTFDYTSAGFTGIPMLIVTFRDGDGQGLSVNTVPDLTQCSVAITDAASMPTDAKIYLIAIGPKA